MRHVYAYADTLRVTLRLHLRLRCHTLRQPLILIYADACHAIRYYAGV